MSGEERVRSLVAEIVRVSSECGDHSLLSLSSTLLHLHHTSFLRSLDRFGQGLPREALTLIFSHLGAESLARCSLVCRSWRAAATDRTLWLSLFLSRFPDGPCGGLVTTTGFKRVSLEAELAARTRAAERLVVGTSHNSTSHNSTADDHGGPVLRDVRVHGGEVFALAAMRGSGLLFMGMGSGAVAVVVGGEARPGTMLRGHTRAVRALDAVDGVLVSGSTDSTVKVWFVNVSQAAGAVTAAITATLLGHRGPVFAVKMLAAPGAGPALVASAGFDHRVLVHNAVTAEQLLELTGHTGRVNALEFLPLAAGRTLLLSGSEDESIRCWDLRSGALVCTVAGSRRAISALKFLPTEGFVLSAAHGTLRAIPVAAIEAAAVEIDSEGLAVAELGTVAYDQHAPFATSHMQRITAIDATPDLIVTCAKDGSVFLRSARTRALLRIEIEVPRTEEPHREDLAPRSISVGLPGILAVGYGNGIARLHIATRI
jgi:hypothetical protein